MRRKRRRGKQEEKKGKMVSESTGERTKQRRNQTRLIVSFCYF